MALDELDQAIADAYTQLQHARAAANRSPNSDTLHTEAFAELRVNRLLERRHNEQARGNALVSQ